MRLKNWKMILLAFAMGLLIFDSRTAIKAAAEGLQLCIQTVIPSLFPFCMMGILFTGKFPQSDFLRPPGKAFRLKPGTEQLLVTGFLGGYPIGAQSTAHLHQKGALTRDESRRLLSFISQPGPAFIFGILGNTFPLRQCWSLWLILLLSAWLVSMCIPASLSGETAVPAAQTTNLTDAMGKALSAMGTICGWIVWMRVCIGFADKWLFRYLHAQFRIIFTGILELTNGCCMLPSVENEALRFVLASGFLSFGGICVTLQTASVIGDLGVDMYLKGKLLQTLICICLSAAWMGYLYALLPVMILFPVINLRNTRKNSSFPEIIGV